MSTIEFDCPFCSRPMRVSSSAAGKSGKCKSCNNTVVVPKRKSQNTSELPIDRLRNRQRWWHIPKVVVWMLIVLFLPIVAASVWFAFGTHIEKWENAGSDYRCQFTDTVRNRTGLITHRVMDMFDSEGNLLCHNEGQMDHDGKPHGPWTAKWSNGTTDLIFYWHGETCSEEQFYLRTQHLQ